MKIFVAAVALVTVFVLGGAPQASAQSQEGTLLARSMHEVPRRHVPGGFPAKAFSRPAERAWVRKSVPPM
jgi:hypothetical protein